MRKSRWLVIVSFCSLAAMPALSKAQSRDSTKSEPTDFLHDVLGGLFGPNWNVFAHGGITTDDRFLLQQAPNPADGQRELRTATGWEVGGGVGVDILLRMGFRASYTYRSSELDFKTDNGDGSTLLDVNNVGTLKSHTGALEIVKYMLPAGAAVTPYATVGIQGTWWQLDENSPLVQSAGSSTPLSVSPVFSFGIQMKASSKLSARLEATLSGGHNPFTGNKSFRALSGPTIDEPTSVSRTEFRLAGVYHFSRPRMP